MTGEVLADHQIKELLSAGVISNSGEALINPSSLDIRVGNLKWCLTGDFRPFEGEKIEEALKYVNVDYENSDKKKFRVETGNNPCLVRIVEELDLPKSLTGRVHNKSGNARIGLGIKGLVDGVDDYDIIPAGYKGPLYLQISPTVFPVTFQPNETAMAQIRFYEGNPEPLKGWELELLLRKHPILTDDKCNPAYTKTQRERIISSGEFTFTADLSQNSIYYRPHLRKTLDLTKRDFYNPFEFFKEERASEGAANVAHVPAGEFILLKSLQHIRVPPGYAAEIAPYFGDVRVHLAGLVNAGHGHSPEGEPLEDSYIVFEMQTDRQNRKIRHDQSIARFNIYKMSSEPENSYMKLRTTNFGDLRSFMPKFFKKS
jgi:dCTP deaminase